ncbi:DUF3300 domain-containing protein [Polynucleobacter necessarius]|uniref:DUF3300 domain-containing protein n=1 Tax=Polynucleobacter necessarius TaxID=576610 RepID=UPI0013B0557A|nr:DUF3300 domain-containing protein [Polynucleobacter necessarius]
MGVDSSAPHSLSNAQLESLVSPIALYPDSLLSLMLLASTYPLEVAEAYNWRANHSKLAGADLQNALKAQSWNDSVKSLMSFPKAFNMMGNQLQWTQNLGNAYKLQPAQTMSAVQSLRKRAMRAGKLNSNQQMTVTTDANGNILIIPTNSQIVYVPSYSPDAVYGPWPYPDYPPYPVYNSAWGAMSFGVGLAVGDAFWATPAWSSGTINVNNTASNSPGDKSRGVIGPSSIQNQQRLLNDWKNNATPAQKQAARSDAQRANSAFDKNATPQELAQANRLNQEARNAVQQDRSSPNLDREAMQENALREQARMDADDDRFNEDRFGGGAFRGGFGAGRMGGFRR